MGVQGSQHLRGVAGSTRQRGEGAYDGLLQAQLWVQSGRGRTCPHVTAMGDQWLGSVRGGPPPSRGRSVENFLSPGPRGSQGGLYGGGHTPGGAFYPPGWGGLNGDYGIASLDMGPGHARKGVERSKSFSQGDPGEKDGMELTFISGLKFKNLSGDLRPLPRPQTVDFERMR